MAAGRVLVEVAEELVLPGIERSDIDLDRAAGGDDLLAVQVEAFEFLGRRIQILDDQLHLRVGGDGELLRIVFVILDRQREVPFRRSRKGHTQKDEAGENESETGHEGVRCSWFGPYLSIIILICNSPSVQKTEGQPRAPCGTLI